MKLRLSVAALALIAASSLQAADYKPVTDDRLKNPEPENWLLTKGNYEGWSYTPLDQITPDNVSKLKPVWSAATGVNSGHEAPAVINGDYMFVATPHNNVLAFDAKTGKFLWRYVRETPEGLGALHRTNRGVALWGDKVYVGSIDCVLTALDAKTGEKVWEETVCDWEKESAYITSAPLAVKGKIIIGPSGGEFGVRGFIKAFDAETGKLAWTRYSIPAPGEPGSETWPQEGEWKDAWKNGGGTMWMPGNYDAKNDVIYWGVGNGAPWIADQRPGDNLYVASSLAINPDTGDIVGHFQYHYNDGWDWAAMNAPTLVEFNRDGKKVPGLISAQRNGVLYWLDRDDKVKITFSHAEKYVHNNVFKSIDPKTGRPTYNDEAIPKTGKAATYCPSLWGGKDWPYEAYSPKSGMLYIPFNDNHCMTLTGMIQPILPGQWSAGVDINRLDLEITKGFKYIGGIQAWSVDDRTEVWRETYPGSWNWGSILTTGGGVLFAGGTNDRLFRAYDEKTGKLLWQFPTPSGIISPPSAFSVDGKQYIAVVSGYGVDAQWIQGKMHTQEGWEKSVPEGGSVWVFALGD
ncbi:PQQ-dependent dehydrogenase, methanol/ethanol family [Hyphomicrobium sp.]|uniref:PQQ-dependent dehydrogenase, methanol/ethanol family n=1 Tax=Hyphomicrobium sp. TaxID=82 RepID=UPI0025B8A322|nr:PQQ-dependent dehydrogenase, methanol/ethanol family [Hyphomicrobium sp.]MCC7253960.1 PQQ-dependent dehydrogenase, methanol/ethanol family [Hyphomicrobium sp.]